MTYEKAFLRAVIVGRFSILRINAFKHDHICVLTL